MSERIAYGLGSDLDGIVKEILLNKSYKLKISQILSLTLGILNDIFTSLFLKEQKNDR